MTRARPPAAPLAACLAFGYACASLIGASACDRTKVLLAPDGGAGSTSSHAGNGGANGGNGGGGNGGGGSAGASGGAGHGGATTGHGGASASGGIAPTGGSAPDTGGAAGQTSTAAAFDLVGPPLVSAPTAHGFLLDTVLRAGDPASLRAQVRAEGSATWIDLGAPTVAAPDLARWMAHDLAAGTRHDYQISGTAPGETTPRTLAEGSAVTARPKGQPFTFALIADTHIEMRDVLPPGQTVPDDTWGSDEATMLEVMHDLATSHADFVLNLGDMVDYHVFGFNDPPPDAAAARLGYLSYRRVMGDGFSRAAHFPVIGNWEGENGCNSAAEIARSTGQRMLYAPAPGSMTTPEGGSPNQDYYAFTWGDALFVVLNVMTYTPTCHRLSYDPGLPNDWTLGAAQMAWLDKTLAAATSKWRFTFIHHTVGGAAGDPDNSAYGRGGGQAAHVGEQAVIHAMLQKYGVQVFFYAHDHVFTDMTVDGIHYTLPGSAGAPWKFTPAETGYSTFWPDSGHARVQVSPDQVQVDFVATGGQVLTGYTLK